MAAAPLPVSCMMRLTEQRYPHPDCTIATIASLSGQRYETVLAEAAQVAPTVLLEGLTWQQMRKVCARLKLTVRLVPKSKFDLDEATGILHVYAGRRANAPKRSHVVLLWNGHVIDGGFELWQSVDDFLAANRYKAGSLLQLVKS